MATEYTDNYDLDLYVGEDKPNLRDQYNAAMNKIDTALFSNATQIGDANEAITQIRAKDTVQDTKLDSLTSELQSHATDISALKETTKSQGQSITSNVNAISSLNTRMVTAEGEIDTLQANVGTLQTQINNVSPKWTQVKSGAINLGSIVEYPSGQRTTIEYKVERWGNLYRLLLGNNKKFAIKRVYGGTEVKEITELQDFFPASEYHSFSIVGMTTVNAENTIGCVVFSNNPLIENRFGIEIPTLGTPMPINCEYFWVKN